MLMSYLDVIGRHNRNGRKRPYVWFLKVLLLLDNLHEIRDRRGELGQLVNYLKEIPYSRI